MPTAETAVPITSALASSATSVAATKADISPPEVKVPAGGDPPVRKIDPQGLRELGQKLDFLFRQYLADRRIAELRWLRNERQYLGLYDPEIEKELSVNRSRAYPRVTRVKCISVLSRLMNLMFPGNEKNWELKASPSPDITMDEVKEAMQDFAQDNQDAGVPQSLGMDDVEAAIQVFCDKRAETMSKLIDGQLQELGGDQTLDYIGLNRSVIRSGIIYGVGCLRGPYARPCRSVTWKKGPDGQPTPTTRTIYKPMFEWLRIWDFYPDMSAKRFEEMDGYFTRVVMSRAQIRKLANREDFFKEQILSYLTNHQMGNYRPQMHEIELRAMGVKVNVNEMKTETSKYEVIVWHGQVSGTFLSLAGVEVDQDKLADDLDAEIWMIDGNVIKADLNPWVMLETDVKTLHTFLFDEDDTSPVGFGLPNAIRDSQMAIAASTRMLLDNASVTCGPQLELNTDLLRPDQDLASTSGYKIWYREGLGPEAQYPAVRNVQIDAHLEDLQKIIDMFMKFADMETFVGPATGGDMENIPSEPMRTAAGASMLRADTALPFKDIVRAFDTFTQSVILSLVLFNRKFNPDLAPDADYDVIARGATSMIAKEVRGLQVDQLVATLTPGEMLHVDERKLAIERFKVRDMGDLLVSESEAKRRKEAQDQQQAQQAQQQQEMMEAQIRKFLSDSFKNIAQGQKNSAAADADSVATALSILEHAAGGGLGSNGVQQTGGGGSAQGGQPPVPEQGSSDSGGGGLPGNAAGGGQGGDVGLPQG